MKKGQAALEFMATYGWAVLVLLIMIGAISYFGILNPNKVLPDKCIMGADFTCVDFIIDGTDVQIQMKQGVGKTIYYQGFSCDYRTTLNHPVDKIEIDGSALLANDPWSPRSNVIATCGLPELSGLQGEKVKINFNMTYQLSTNGFLHTVDGELFTEVR